MIELIVMLLIKVGVIVLVVVFSVMFLAAMIEEDQR